MSDIELDYESLTQNALRRVVADVLQITAELGETPGEHHFYIEFMTAHPGVDIPEFLHKSYPERMTIVLHHQFQDLNLSEDGFSVTLWFKRVEAQLTIPFDAITSFADPSVKFGLRFVEEENGLLPEIADDTPSDDAAPAKPDIGKEEVSAEDDQDEPEKSADVVSLDAFRKK